VDSSFIEALSVGMTVTPQCSVWHLLQSLSDVEKSAVVETMRRCVSTARADKPYSFSWLSRLLTDSGKGDIAAITLRRHMRGECSCDGSTR
jgi:hypothetical protein